MDQTSPLIRLNKFIAQQLGISRRQADEFIVQKRVQVNDKYAILGTTINPTIDRIQLDKQHLAMTPKEHLYVLFHKPKNYVCSRRQQGLTPTIYALLPKRYQHLNPVGRLDKDSSGILLLTNDGDLALRLTHPRYQKVKVYEVGLDKPLQPLHHQHISDLGLQLTDGHSQLQLTPLDESRMNWQITMHEGRHRQIRRTFAALGYEVKSLHRIQFGPYNIEQLEGKTFLEISSPNIS
jgi:23S rRNA pseudouridine2605 synthase